MYKSFSQTELLQVIPARPDQFPFYNRHQRTSINAMVVSGSEHEIYHLSCNHPGSYHDSEIFLSSDLFTKLHVEHWRPFAGAVMLADSAYRGVYPFMATPYLPNAVVGNPHKVAYNAAFKKVRSSVERTIGIWKKRFPVLKYGLRFRIMENAARIIQILGKVFENNKKVS